MDTRAPGTQLARYDTMCRAIDAAYEVDEVKDIHDRAQALEEAEDRCYQIRWRAANKAGELLKAMEKAKGGGDRKSADYHRSKNSTGDPSDPLGDGGYYGPLNKPKTLAELGISKQQSSDWQKVAADDAEKPSARYYRNGLQQCAPGGGHRIPASVEPKLRLCSVPTMTVLRDMV